MGQRQALLLATFLTTFGLVLIGAVAMRLTNNPATPENEVLTQSETAPLTTTQSTTATVLTPDEQAVSELMASRQASYEQALSQANAQLQAANEQLAQLQGGLTGSVPVAAAPNAAPANSGVAVSPEMAGQIAVAAAPNTTVTAVPFLVDFQGTVAYEVTTAAGLLYIDANAGTVLFNGAVPASAPIAPTTAPVQQQPAPTSVPQVPAAPTTAPVAPPAPTAAPAAPAPATTISEAQALEIAIAAVGPGTVDKMKLEEEHGILIWDVKFTNDNEVRIDAYTGAIVRTRIENDND